MSMWGTIEPRLKSLMRVVAFLLSPTNPYLIMAANKTEKAQVLASRIKGKGEGEEVLSDFWDYTCDLTVKTAFWTRDTNTFLVVVMAHKEIIIKYLRFLSYLDAIWNTFDSCYFRECKEGCNFIHLWSVFI